MIGLDNLFLVGNLDIYWESGGSERSSQDR